MRIEDLAEARDEALRFLDRVNAILDDDNEKRVSSLMYMGGPETSAVKRSSLDLTRSLAKMRRS